MAYNGSINPRSSQPRHAPAAECAYLDEDVDDGRHQTGINDGLYLVGLAGSDVGDGPGGLLLDVGASMCEEGREVLEHTAVQHSLRLLVAARHSVPHRSQGGRLEGGEGRM